VPPDRKVDAWLVNRVRTLAGFLHRSTGAVRQGAEEGRNIACSASSAFSETGVASPGCNQMFTRAEAILRMRGPLFENIC
jgi:hypothetical protein